MHCILKSKIHRATVTRTDKDYVGSITVDRSLMDAAGLIEYEKVLVADIDNGSRFETYVIGGGKGAIEVNGAAANIAEVGDKVIIMSFALVGEGEGATAPKIVVVDEENKVTG